MAGIPYTTTSITGKDTNFAGGLNSTSGPLNVQNNEASDLLNIDFNKFGSILKRNGYAAVNTVGISAAPIDGLHWYETVGTDGNTSRYAMCATNGKIYKMDALDGTWDDITGPVTVTSGNHMEFENFNNKVYMTNGINAVIEWAGVNTCKNNAVTTVLSTGKYLKQFNNYLFLANVSSASTVHSTRVQWSNIRDPDTWEGDQWVEVGYNDGMQITGMDVLSDRLVVYKERSVYNIFFTGDADFPFILPGGGKSNSNVGCIANASIQSVENGHVFLSYDGLYYYDGNNSTKLSDKISSTLGVDRTTDPTIIFDPTIFASAVSCVQRSKNRYFLALKQSGSTSNDGVIVWDFYNNAFSVYTGMAPSAMCTFYVNGNDERPHFADYSGFMYRMDTGTNDYPKNILTAIKAYYYTNWKNFDDLCDQKGIPHVYLYYRNESTAATLSLSYSYDFTPGDSYTQTFNLTTGTSPLWGTAIWGQFNWGQTGGGLVMRRDLTGRGRVARIKFANGNAGETFRIDGLGTYVHAETNV
jgi:hypothetical protein